MEVHVRIYLMNTKRALWYNFWIFISEKKTGLHILILQVTIKEKQLDKLIAESRSALANTQLFSEPAVGADDQKKKSNKL